MHLTIWDKHKVLQGLNRNGLVNMPIKKRKFLNREIAAFYFTQQIYLLYWKFDMYFLNICLLNLICLIIMRRQWQPIPVLLPGKSHGRRSLVGCSPWGHEELDTTEQLHFHFSLVLEKEMATHSNVLAWRIPGTGEPGGPPSAGSHRVGHDWSNLAAAAWKNLICISSKKNIVSKKST